MHSTTKYLGGHSDAIGGMLVTNDADVAARVKFFSVRHRSHTRAVGLLLDHARDSYLAVRMDGTRERREGGRNAVASRADRASLVPGLETHPNHRLP